MVIKKTKKSIVPKVNTAHLKRPKERVSIFSKCLCLEVEFHKPGNERQLSQEESDVIYEEKEDSEEAKKVDKQRLTRTETNPSASFSYAKCI